VSSSWKYLDNLYEVAQNGTRGIVVLNETAGKVKVIYTSSESGSDILYKESSTSAISFGSVNTLITVEPITMLLVPSRTTQEEIVIMASNSSTLVGVLASDTDPSLVAQWKMDESTGATTIDDASTYNNDGALTGSPTFEAGSMQAITLNGTSQYAEVSDAASLDIQMQLQWLRGSSANKQSIQPKEFLQRRL